MEKDGNGDKNPIPEIDGLKIREELKQTFGDGVVWL